MLYFQLFFVVGARPTKTYRQVLPPIPGYIPVYIQDGDVPPDVESIYEIASTLLQAPPQPNSDAPADDIVFPAQIYDKDNNNEDDSLKESEAFIMHQLTDNSPTADNELEAAGTVIQELNDNDGSPGQVVEISSNDSGIERHRTLLYDVQNVRKWLW